MRELQAKRRRTQCALYPTLDVVNTDLIAGCTFQHLQQQLLYICQITTDIAQVDEPRKLQRLSFRCRTDLVRAHAAARQISPTGSFFTSMHHLIQGPRKTTL